MQPDEVEAAPSAQGLVYRTRAFAEGLWIPAAFPSSVLLRRTASPQGEANGTASLPLAGEGAPARGRMRSKLPHAHKGNSLTDSLNRPAFPEPNQ